jgi:hypothetical protein
MTQTILESPSAVSKYHRASHRPAGRHATVIVLICSLVCTAVMKEWAADRQQQATRVRATVASRSTFGSMDSFTLALVLGGLRGPLVMYLWPAIENQKVDRNLEDLNTMIEWVRLLQPEFDSVHMFQMWNKAYNISAMKASSANKYTEVMDAIDYGEKVNQQKPGDINILCALQDIYGGKLGSSNLPEFSFYSRQFREDSMTPANRDLRYPADKGRRRLAKSDSPEGFWFKPLLGDDEKIRPDLLEPTRDRAMGQVQMSVLEKLGWPLEKKPGAEWNDGSELQYLGPFGKFPYGVSPLAMSYNYAKRAQVALTEEGQRQIQSTAMVLDSQPALSLRFWQEDETKYGRRFEASAFGIDENDPNADTLLTKIKSSARPVNKDAFAAALYSYDLAVRLAQKALVEYDRHLSTEYGNWRIDVYRPHKEEMNANIAFNAADRDYLKAMMIADPHESRILLDRAAQNYRNAMLAYERIVLRYFTEDAALWPDPPPEMGPFLLTPRPAAQQVMPGNLPPRQKASVLALTDEQILGTPGTPGVFEKAMKAAKNLRLDQRDHVSDQANYQVRIDRCRARIDLIYPNAIPLRTPGPFQ